MRPFWVQAGSSVTYALVVDGRIEALVYWQPADPADPEGQDDWFWVAADRPQHHSQVDAPHLPVNGSYDQLEDAVLCPQCGSTNTRQMEGQSGDRGGRWLGGEWEKPSRELDEWMKCEDCETFSRRPVSGEEWEPRPELTLPASERR